MEQNQLPMKKYILFIFYALGLFSCNYQTFSPIKYYPNEFDTGNKYLLSQKFYPRIKVYEEIECTLQYERITEGKKSNRVYFIIKRNIDVVDLIPMIHIKIDSSVEHIKIHKINSSYFTEETPETKTTTIDSTGISTSTSSGSVDHWNIDKFYIDITPEIMSKIDVSKSLSYRLYYGPEPVTIKYQFEKLNQLKELYSKK